MPIQPGPLSAGPAANTPGSGVATHPNQAPSPQYPPTSWKPTSEEKKLIDETHKRMSKLKLELMMRPNTVFYTTILFSLKLIVGPHVKTAGVDGVHLFINPDYFMDLTEDQQIGLLCHEILHIALMHIGRGTNYEHDRFNRAGDYVINLMLKENGYGLPSGGLYDEKYREKNTEEVYADLKDEEAQNGGGAGGGIPGSGTDILAPPQGMTPKQAQNHATDMVLRAANQARNMGDKGIGSIPGGVELMLEKFLNPKLPWYVILRNFLNDFNKDDYSMTRPNRRFLPDYYLPGAKGECIKNLCIAVDVSGSVSMEEFSYFVTEIAHIQELMQPEKLTLISFDTEVQNIHTANESTNLFKDLKFTGGGGTDVEPIYEWINENKPEVCLIFTDGGFWPPEGVVPEQPVIFLINNNDRFESEVGEVIHYDIPRQE